MRKRMSSLVGIFLVAMLYAVPAPAAAPGGNMTVAQGQPGQVIFYYFHGKFR